MSGNKRQRPFDPEFYAEWRRHCQWMHKKRREQLKADQHQRRLRWLEVTKAMQRGEPSA